MLSTQEADGNTSHHGPAASAELTPREYLLPHEMTKYLKHVFVRNGRRKVQLVEITLEAMLRHREQASRTLSCPQFYSLYPHHIVLYPTPDQPYKVEFEYNGG